MNNTKNNSEMNTENNTEMNTENNTEMNNSFSVNSSLFSRENTENENNRLDVSRYFPVHKELLSTHICLKENKSNNIEDLTISSDKLCFKEKSSIDNIINEGKIILKENDFFNDLHNLMNNSEFRNFYDKHFNDFTNTQIVLLYIKLYETLQIEYKEKNGYDIEKEVLAYIMKELMSNNISRKNIIKAFNNYSENKNKNGKKRYLLDIFENKKNIIK